MWDLSEVLDILNRWLLDNLLLQQVSFNSPILNWQKVKIYNFCKGIRTNLRKRINR
jgi:hypothetical protein